MTYLQASYSVKQFLLHFIPYVVFFFSPIRWMLVTVGILVFVDSFTGLYAAKKRGEKIRSHGLSRAIAKCIMYSIAILLARMMEVVFLPWLPLTSITSGYIALVEFKSNLENISDYTGIDIWKAVLDKMSSFKK